VRRPGPRPAPLGRPGHISGVPSRPKHPAQPLALVVGSPRAAQVAGKGYFSASVRGSPHPTGPACSYDPCASKLVSVAFASCAVHERQAARPVSRRRAARPTGLPIARNCGARRHLPSCGSVRKSPRASPHPRLGPPAGQLRAAAKPATLRALATTATSPLCQSDLLGIADGSARKTPVANAQDRALPGAPCEITPKSRTGRPEAGDVEGPGTFQTAVRVGRVCGLDRSQLHPSAHEHSPVHVRVPVHALPK
jgi:hypothetical protein